MQGAKAAAEVAMEDERRPLAEGDTRSRRTRLLRVSSRYRVALFLAIYPQNFYTVSVTVHNKEIYKASQRTINFELSRSRLSLCKGNNFS